jgi:ureidoglycolate lyase
MIIELKLQKLTRGNFSSFGEVIETDGAERIMINEGTTERFHDLANIDVESDGGHTLVNIFRGQPRPQPIEIKMMERHPLGSQAFIPLQNKPYLIVVAPVGASVSPQELQAFRAEGHQGVNYKRDLWHHPLLVLENDHDFLVVDRGGPEENCTEYWFTEVQGNAQIDL